jgi:AAA15 family ATPase/GTPase
MKGRLLMHSISVKNFGPLVNVQMQSDRFIFLLGEQASGKSTLAKLFYFFRTLRDEFISVVFKTESDDWRGVRNTCLSLLRRKFTGIFGETKLLGNFDLTYSYDDGKNVSIKPSSINNYFLEIVLSHDLDKKIESVYQRAQRYLSIDKDNAYDIYQNILNEGEEKKDIISELRTIFCDNSNVIYIPAGRAFLSNQPLLQLIQGYEMRSMNPDEPFAQYDFVDAPTRNYIYEVNRTRQRYLSPQIHEMFNKQDRSNKNDCIFELTRNILKGSYEVDKSGEYIRIKNNKKVKISYASSGQQEVLWLLNLLCLYSIEKRKCLLIIEEPEAHLHPEAQYMLAKSVAAFGNYTNSEVLITTHSPYILSSFNNLIYAGKCGKFESLQSKLNQIIQKESWIEPEAFSSYILEQGKCRDIKDVDLAMIDIAELDAVASAQDTEYEKMLRLYSEAKQ